MKKEFYHGWVIRVVQKPAGYCFECRMIDRHGRVSDAQCYSTPEQALQAGRLRADLESVRLSLTSFLRGKLKLVWLYPDEQTALENSIDRYINTV
ncbi:hypothetical protein H6F67_03680 [Microcoleus sp. FACHB-1515]|uniref:hypothetical protein n=1 Tax=Cyanophyceae TaxID=3028117 RepID=UPI00168A2276|nr:hypothetical protein [Microcoleus sp. FACHB-1515]MBD2088952.1 hypothetical protein [Microcoleus sp. FACHB-1515]